MKLTQNEFLNRCYLIWSNKYDYENTIFINTKTKIEVKCPEHGIFIQYPQSHLKGQEGCNICKKNNRVKSTKEGFKICSKCNLEKELYNFNKNANYCKVCSKEYGKSRKEYHMKFYEENKENILVVRREYIKNNNDKILEYSSKYYEDNKDQLKITRKKYYEDNKEKLNRKQMEYYYENKEVISIKKKEYNIKNVEKLKEYREENKEKLREMNNKYREVNKEKLKDYNKEYFRNRLENDYFFKFKHNLKTSIRNSIFKMGYTKKSKTYEIIGISYVEFKIYIENQFTEGMSWDNHGEWHLDHKIPISWGKTEEEVIKLNNYKNFQPLWSQDNLSKGNRYES